jgi:hypothetical protein
MADPPLSTHPIHQMLYDVTRVLLDINVRSAREQLWELLTCAAQRAASVVAIAISSERQSFTLPVPLWFDDSNAPEAHVHTRARMFPQRRLLFQHGSLFAACLTMRAFYAANKTGAVPSGRSTRGRVPSSREQKGPCGSRVPHHLRSGSQPRDSAYSFASSAVVFPASKPVSPPDECAPSCRGRWSG